MINIHSEQQPVIFVIEADLHQRSQCPLWVKSRHVQCKRGMSALCHKRTSRHLFSDYIYWLCGPFDACVDFAAKRPKINGLGEKRLSATLQGYALSLRIAVRGDHDNRDVRSSRLSLG